MPSQATSFRPRDVGAALLALVIAWMFWPTQPVDAGDPCPDLNALINAASPGSIVDVPACDYRAEIAVDRPLILRASPGATISGADVWTAWNDRVSADVLPVFDAADVCETTRACLDRDLVIADGTPLERVERNPASGQFALDPDRHVVLGDDPAGRLVEVVVRQTWLVVNASDVTVEGFKMRYAANAAQTGAVRVKAGVARFTLRDCDLGFAAGANVSFGVANDSVVENCDIHDAGQLGVHLGGDGTNGRDNVLRNNDIHDNNTAGFDPEWEAGGVKATRQTGLRLVGNTVANNVGPGLWCDIYCRDIVVSGNRIHHNTHAGVFFEVSTGAKIADNAVWENGWGKASWGWGAGILISSSGGAEVSGNTVAWNYAGISVISQNRTDWNHTETNNNVHDNVIVAEYDRWAAFWGQDWSGILFDGSSNNRGSNNRYWVNHAEDDEFRFAWSGGLTTLAAFNATPAESGGTYLTDNAKTSILSGAGIPVEPDRGRPAASPTGSAFPSAWHLALGCVVGLLVVAGGVLVKRRGRTGAGR